jgi:chorismate-pyruvate lyase
VAVDGDHGGRSTSARFSFPDGLSSSLRLLLASGGTFIDLLEVCVREPVEIRKVAVTRTRLAQSLSALDAPAGTLVIDRLVLLRRVSSHEALADAQSRIIPARLPTMVVDDLDNTSMPLGQILVDRGVLTSRRLIAIWTESAAQDSGQGAFIAGEPMVCRTYVISVEAGPAILITERLREFGPWNGPA